MKIGIVSSWIDTLALFQILTRYDNEYLVYCDQTKFPYWEKSLDYVLDCIEKAGEFLTQKWAEMVIVDPVYELALKYSDNKL
jgi:glutamate racemase